MKKDQHGYIFTYIFSGNRFSITKAFPFGLKFHDTLGILFTFLIHKTKRFIVSISNIHNDLSSV